MTEQPTTSIAIPSAAELMRRNAEIAQVQAPIAKELSDKLFLFRDSFMDANDLDSLDRVNPDGITFLLEELKTRVKLAHTMALCPETDLTKVVELAYRCRICCPDEFPILKACKVIEHARDQMHLAADLVTKT